MQTFDLTLWPVFGLLKPQFLSTLEKFYIFAQGQQALLWTRDDKVFYICKPKHSKCWTVPLEMSCLSGQRVTYANQGPDFVILLTEAGDLFLWAPPDSRTPVINHYGKPTIVARGIQKANAGRTHIAMVDSSGKFSTLGLNNYGQLGIVQEQTLTPEPVMEMMGCDIAEIACDSTTTYVLTAKGNVYHWGTFNGAFTLDEPELLKLPRYLQGVIKSIVVFDSSLLALTTDGHVYHLVYNEFREIVILRITEENIPPIAKLVSLGRVGVILQSSNKKFYFYSAPNEMKKIETESAVDLTALIGTQVTPEITWISEEAKGRGVSDFNNPMAPNAVKVKVLGVTIYANRAKLTRSFPLMSLLEDPIRSRVYPNELTIPADTFPSYPATFIYLRYLHTNRLDSLVPFAWDLYIHIARLEDHDFMSLLSRRIVDILCTLRKHDDPQELVKFLDIPYQRDPFLFDMFYRGFSRTSSKRDSSLAQRLIRYILEPLP